MLGTIALLLGTTAGTATVAISTTSNSSTTRGPLTVTVTASPVSGSTVHPGATITYRLKATSQRPLPAGATVVDDLSGLLGHASIATTSAGLAGHGLTLDRGGRKLTWAVPALGAAGSCSKAEADRLQTYFEPRLKDITGADRGLAQTREQTLLCSALKAKQDPAAILR